MKPFDLQKALAGEPVVTRDGREVTQVTKFDATEEQLPIYAVVDEEVYSFTDDGFYFPDKDDSPYDLFMATKTVKKEGWINLYRSMDGKRVVPGGKVFDCKTKAVNCTGGIDVIATVKIQWEEEI